MRTPRPARNVGPAAVNKASPQARSPLAPAGVLALQRAAGNAAVARLLGQHGLGRGAEQRSAVDEVLAAPGQPLAEPLRSEMEARLGADFSDVRVHTGTHAQRSAAEIGARAYTSGNHVVIGDGAGDRHTLAHELTHVIQQRRGPVAGTDTGNGLRVSDPDDRFEREAEANATRVMSGRAVQRMAKGDGGKAKAKGKKAAAEAPAEKQSTPLGDQTLVKETVDGTQVTIVLDSHQNKHQKEKIGELGLYKGPMGTMFAADQGLEWHRKNTAAFLLGCAPELIGEGTSAGGLQWNWTGPQGSRKATSGKKSSVDVDGRQVIFDAVAELKGQNLVITYHCNPA